MAGGDLESLISLVPVSVEPRYGILQLVFLQPLPCSDNRQLTFMPNTLGKITRDECDGASAAVGFGVWHRYLAVGLHYFPLRSVAFRLFTPRLMTVDSG
nr:hypothetical protein Itr_chr11CG12190 [Ipomoea trifida]